jgi:hypothetical protein
MTATATGSSTRPSRCGAPPPTDYSIYLDTLIRTQVVPALQAQGATVTYVPLMDYFDANGNLVAGALSANLPTIAALHGLTTDELSNNLLTYKTWSSTTTFIRTLRPMRCSGPTCSR